MTIIATVTLLQLRVDYSFDEITKLASVNDFRVSIQHFVKSETTKTANYYKDLGSCKDAFSRTPAKNNDCGEPWWDSFMKNSTPHLYKSNKISHFWKVT